MTKIAQIILTSSLTILGGALVLVAGQIAIKFFVEPVHELRKFLGEIQDALIFYANLPPYEESNEQTRKTILEAKDLFRQQASRLIAKRKIIPWYRCLAKLKIVAPEKNIEEIHRGLIGLSNSMMGHNYDDLKYYKGEIIKYLN